MVDEAYTDASVPASYSDRNQQNDSEQLKKVRMQPTPQLCVRADEAEQKANEVAVPSQNQNKNCGQSASVQQQISMNESLQI